MQGLAEGFEGGCDERLYEGVVGAAEQESFGVGGGGESFGEVDA